MLVEAPGGHGIAATAHLLERDRRREPAGHEAHEHREQVDAYAGTPAAFLRAHAATRLFSAIPGDVHKMARAMIDAADAAETPRRLLLGSDAYRLVHTALSDRLAFVEAQRELTLSTDADDYTPATA